jgi:hypothetical protein
MPASLLEAVMVAAVTVVAEAEAEAEQAGP